MASFRSLGHLSDETVPIAPRAGTEPMFTNRVDALKSMRSGYRTKLSACALLLPTLAGFLSPASAHAQENQGVYLDRLTINETENAVARISTQNAAEDLFVTDFITGDEVYRQNVAASEQTNGLAPWIDAEWPRSETIPSLPPGLYMVQVDPSAVVPSTVAFAQETYRVPLFVAPTTSTADVLLISPSLTSVCYNQWGGGRSCYTLPNTDVGYKRPGYVPQYYMKMKVVIDRLEDLGHSWDVIDEQYLETNPEFIKNYRAAIIVEQVEYATYDMRQAYDGYVDSGGRLLILGNELWIFMMRKTGDVYQVYKGLLVDPFASDGDPGNDHLIADDSVESDPGPDYPMTRSAGTSYWLARHPDNTHWTAHRTSHWFYDDTDLSDGEAFRIGLVRTTQLMDGVTTKIVGGLPYVRDHETYEIPLGTMILATIPTSDAQPWDCEFRNWNRPECTRPGTAAITIMEKAGGGVVMVIPDKRWLSNSDPISEQLLDNALDAFADSNEMDVYAGYQPMVAEVPASRVWGLSAIAGLLLLLGVFHLRGLRSR